MTTYNTGNPLGSSNPRDLYDNAENLDEAVNSDASSFIDRLGKARPTLKGAIDPTGLASSAAASAQQAETARDAAFVNADVYPDIATGRAAVVNGEQFQVVEGDEIVRYQRNSASAQTEVARYPSSQLTRGLRGSVVSGMAQSAYKPNLISPDLSSCSVPLTLGYGANTWSSDVRVHKGIKVFNFTALVADSNYISYSFRAPVTEFEQVASFSQVVEKSDVVISAVNSQFTLRGIGPGGGAIPGASIVLNISDSGFTTRLVTDSTYIGLDGVDISAIMPGAAYIEIIVALEVRDAVAGTEIKIHSPCFVGDVAAQFRPSYPEYISTEGEAW